MFDGRLRFGAVVAMTHGEFIVENPLSGAIRFKEVTFV